MAAAGRLPLERRPPASGRPGHAPGPGRGVGTRLLAPGLARADRDGLACYLTTARRENLRFYGRLGFQVEHDALHLAPDGPTSWGMRRPREPDPAESSYRRRGG